MSGERRVPLLCLLGRWRGRREVGHGRRHDQDVASRKSLPDGREHFVGRRHVDHAYAGRAMNRHRRRDERDARASVAGRRGDGIPHLPRRAIAEESDRVDGLARAAGGHDNAPTLEASVPAKQRADLVEDVVDRRHSPGAVAAGRETADGGTCERDAASAQRLDVGLRRRVLPHRGVHGRRDEKWGTRGQCCAGEEVVGDSLRQLGDHVGGGWRNDERVGDFGQRDVLDREWIGEVEHPGSDRSPGQGAERGGSDKLCRVLGHHRVHGEAGLRETAGEIGRLVGGDGARDAKDNVSLRHSLSLERQRIVAWLFSGVQHAGPATGARVHRERRLTSR
jgi:hypothetical protein